MSSAGRLSVGKPITVTGTGSPQVVMAQACVLLGFMPLSGISLTLAVYNNPVGDTSNPIFSGLGISLGGWADLPFELDSGLTVTIGSGTKVVFSVI